MRSRQPGSAFKPFVYLTALERGLRPDTVRDRRAGDVRQLVAEEFQQRYRGPVTLKEALALSINTVAAQLAYEVGPEAVVQTAKRMGINSPLAANPSIALGTSEVTLLELTGAYAPFANGGYRRHAVRHPAHPHAGRRRALRARRLRASARSRASRASR